MQGFPGSPDARAGVFFLYICIFAKIIKNLLMPDFGLVYNEPMNN